MSAKSIDIAGGESVYCINQSQVMKALEMVHDEADAHTGRSPGIRINLSLTNGDFSVQLERIDAFLRILLFFQSDTKLFP